MSTLPRAALAALFLLAPRASAQSVFRPLPKLARAEIAGGTGGLGGLASLEGAAETERRESFVDVKLLGQAGAGADLEGGSGSVETQRGGWIATFGEKLGAERLFALEVEAEATFYEFDGAGGLIPGSSEPFNDLYRASVAASVFSPRERRSGYFAGLEVGLGGEDEADVGEAVTVGGLAGMRRRAGDDLEISFGLAAQTRLEDDPWVAPFLGFDWRVRDGLELSLRGSELRAKAALSESWNGLVLVDYQIRQYRLNEASPLPEGVIRDEEIRAALGLERSVGDGVSLRLLAGTSLWREFNVLDDRGREVSEQETDPALFAALTLRASL